MKQTKLYITLSIALFFTSICYAQTSFKTIKKDFDNITGNWKGTLTYLDYSSGKPYTMPADLEIKRTNSTNKFIFSNIYPNEKSANSIDTISISNDGKYIDQEFVKSRRKLANGDVEIITEETGKDGNDNKPAIFKHTYTLGKTSYKNRKDVQFVGKTEWINRHEYVYKKKTSR